MSEPITIRVFEVVGSSSCVASDDGQKVYERIAVALKSGRRVNLSFLNVVSLTSAFLNPAIGQLYSSFDEQTIKDNLVVTDMEKSDIALLKRVIDTAKVYFKDPERFKRAAQSILGAEM